VPNVTKLNVDHPKI